MAVPKRKFAGSEILIQAESQGIEVWAEVAKEGNLLSENDVLTKPENQRPEGHYREAISSIFHCCLVARICKFSDAYGLGRRLDSPKSREEKAKEGQVSYNRPSLTR